MEKRIIVCLSLFANCCLAQQNFDNKGFFGTQNSANVCTDATSLTADADIVAMISKVCEAAGFRNRYIAVPCSSIDNCMAKIYAGKPYILYNRFFMNRLVGLSFSNATLPDWKALTIIAHEIGHHVNNHLTNPDPNMTRRQMELEADEYAGRIMHLMGATLSDAKAVMYDKAVPENGFGDVYPSRAERLSAIETGYWAINENNLRNGYVQNALIDNYTYTGTLANGKPNGHGTQTSTTSVGETYTYEGDFVAGEREGNGTITWSGGDKYTGEWKGGYRQGRGIYYFKDGNRYEGDYKNGVQEGKGTFYWASGDKYIGNWVNDERSGKGILYFANGDVYNGNFEKNMRNGYGEYISGSNDRYIINCKDCQTYKGYFKDDEKNGFGDCYDKNGKLLYEGQFANNAPAGTYPSISFENITDYIYPNGTQYTGQWSNNNPNGYGTETYHSKWEGDRYEGYFKDGKRDGQGTYYFANGDKYIGLWVADKKNGIGTFYYANGEKYAGNWVDDNRSGQGTYSWTNGTTYTGEWVNGEKNGYGILNTLSSRYINNCKECITYKGSWQHDVKSGYGVCYDANGNVLYQGQFQNDAPTGQYPN